MSIYDKTKMMCRTWIESVNNLFTMGKDLETEVDGMKGGIVKDVTLTEVDKHYTLTILYDDDTSDTVTWDDSTVGIEDITMTYDDGVYLLTIILTDGTRYTFSIPVGNVVTEEELQDAVDTINATITAMNVGSPDDTASATGSLWARVKNAVSRIGTLETSVGSSSDAASSTGSLWARVKDAVSRIITLETADTNNVKLTGNQNIGGIKYILNSIRKDSELSGRGTMIFYIDSETYDNIPSASYGFDEVMLQDKNGIWYSIFGTEKTTSGDIKIKLQVRSNTNTQQRLELHASGNDGWCSVPHRTVNTTSATYDNDVVTIKTLKELGLI